MITTLSILLVLVQKRQKFFLCVFNLKNQLLIQSFVMNEEYILPAFTTQNTEIKPINI